MNWQDILTFARKAAVCIDKIEPLVLHPCKQSIRGGPIFSFLFESEGIPPVEYFLFWFPIMLLQFNHFFENRLKKFLLG